MTYNNPYTLSFDEIRASDLPLVGGKGANLGEMTNAGFPIPGGFCLTTAAFQQFIQSCVDIGSIYEQLDSISTEDLELVRSAGNKIRQTLLGVSIPTDIIDAVNIAWQAAGADHAYAVRSSATAEDLPDASFAGQQDTYLNIVGKKDLLDAIRQCWVSLFTDRAILYRIQNQFNHRDVKLSVVVQQMVFSEKSGILFTAEPLTGHRQTLTINASFGLGEALVGGLVTPDAYRVDKRTGAILDRQIAEKRIGIFPAKDGGTHQMELSAEQRNQIVLTDGQLLALAELGSLVEAHYGIPQDIEWAMVADDLYLLQTRPITSLYPIDGLKSPDDSLHIYLSLGHQQSMLSAMAPLSLSTIQVLMPIGHEKSRLDNAYIRISGGRMFADLTKPLRHPLLRKALFRVLSQLDALAPVAAKQVTRLPEFQRPHKLHPNFSVLKGAFRIVRRVIAALWSRDLTGFVDRTNALMDEYVQGVARSLDAFPPGKAQIESVLDAMPKFFPFFFNWIPETGAGLAATRLLARVAKRWLTAEEVEALTLGIGGNVVNEMNLAIGDLADVARESQLVVEMFERLGEDGNQWLDELKQRHGSVPFMTAWADFLSRYGARGPSEIDLYQPRWYEEPLPVLRVIAGLLNGEKGRHRAHFHALIEGRAAAIQKLRDRTGVGPLGGVRTRLINRLYHVMTEAGGMREHHKFMVVRLLAVIKEILKRNAVELTAAKKMGQPDDVWFLTWSELLSIWDDNTPDLTSRIAQRRVDLARFEKLTPPMIITSDGEGPVPHYHIEDAPEGALLGNPVSPGVIEGIVRVVRDPQRETIAPNEILVAEFTDPGWTPLFINAGGLILEVGGALTHGAVVAREYGMPAVVGVRDATKILTTGQRVRVDGHRGIIEKL